MISLGRGLVMFIMLMIFFTAIYTALPHRRLSICGQIREPCFPPPDGHSLPWHFPFTSGISAHTLSRTEV